MYQKFKLGMYRDMLCFAWRNWRIRNNARLDMAASNMPSHQVSGRTFVVGGGLQRESYTKKYGRGIFSINPVKLHH
jgi:hypothetical protein